MVKYIIETILPEGDILSWVHSAEWDGPIDYYIKSKDHNVKLIEGEEDD